MPSKKLLFWLAFSLYFCPLHLSANAQATSGAVTLFSNVRIFDGRSPALSAPSNVLVRGNVIDRISREPIAVDRSAETRIIDGGGRTLMPGLSDMHWHAMLVRPTPAIVLGSDIGYTTLLAGAEATATLMRGFTTVRDMGGASFSLKRAIDEGVLPGPRIYPSGAMISVTSGHGDFRQLTDLPRTIGGMLSRVEQLGGSMIADSPDEVRVRVREQRYAGRITDKVDRRRRRRVAVQPPRCIHLYRSRTSRCSRSRRELGNICGDARIHDRFDPASHRSRG